MNLLEVALRGPGTKDDRSRFISVDVRTIPCFVQGLAPETGQWHWKSSYSEPCGVLLATSVTTVSNTSLSFVSEIVAPAAW